MVYGVVTLKPARKKGGMTNLPAYDEIANGTRNISRREFIAAAGAVLAASALWTIGNRIGVTALASQTMLRTLVRSTFLQHVGETFYVRTESAPALIVQLAKVRDLPRAGLNRMKAPVNSDIENNFSILFRGPGSRSLEQGTYSFQHDGIGAFPLFVVPMGQEGDARYYEAIFNRQQA